MHLMLLLRLKIWKATLLLDEPNDITCTKNLIYCKFLNAYRKHWNVHIHFSDMVF